jgi:hypothetical protein
MQFANQPITILGKQKEEGKHNHYPTTDRTIQIQPNLRRKEKKRNEKKKNRARTYYWPIFELFWPMNI